VIWYLKNNDVGKYVACNETDLSTYFTTDTTNIETKFRLLLKTAIANVEFSFDLENAS